MIIVDLYKYTVDNEVIITPLKPDVPYVLMKRITAEEGYNLFNGDDLCSCIDILPEDLNLWCEIKDVIDSEVTE